MPPAPPPPRRPRANLRDLFDSKGVYVSAYDTRLVMNIFHGNEAEAVRVTEAAWQWCINAGLSRRDIERLLRHFQHCHRYEAFERFETTSEHNWQLFDRFLTAFATEQQQRRQLQGGATAAGGGQRVFASFADMLLHARQGLERVTEMLTVPPDELAAFLEALSQRLSPAAVGELVALLPEASPLHFRPSAALAEGLTWMLETLPVGEGRIAALLRLLSTERSLLQQRLPDLQGRLSSLQQAAGLTSEQAAALAYSQPQLLVAGAAAIQEVGSALQVWTRLGLPLEKLVAQYGQAVSTGRTLAALDDSELQLRLSALQQALGATAQQAASVAFAEPAFLQAADPTALATAAGQLRELVPPGQLAQMLQSNPEGLASSLRHIQETTGVLRQWTEVLGLPYAPFMAQRDSPWFAKARRLLAIADSELRQRLATLGQVAGMTAERARELALAAPEVLEVPRAAVEAAATRLQQFLPPEQLGRLLMEEPGLLVARFGGLNRVADVLRVWVQVLAVPPSLCVAHFKKMVASGPALLHYQDSTLRRRMAAIRGATEGLGADQAAALVLEHPELLQKQHTLIREAGQWLSQNMPLDQMGPLLQKDPQLLGSSLWALKETSAKLRLWTAIVGAKREECLAHYTACVSDALLPDLAATYILVQGRAPELLRGPDDSGSLEWWLDQRLALQRIGMGESAAERMLEHWKDSEAGKQLLAQLRGGSIEGWPLPGAPPAQPAASSAPAAPMPAPATGTARRALRSQRSEMDDYNLNRIRSMSETQLRARIHKIRNPSKMRSFLKELEDCGLTELAAEAQAALRAL